MRSLALLLALTSLANASNMEQCSYKSEHDGKITENSEAPSFADGANARRFADIVRKEEAGEEGWKGYKTFDVKCRPLDMLIPEWHMFVQTHNGTVSLAHGLTEDACFYTLHQLHDAPWRGCSGNCSRVVQGSDFERGECFK